MATVIVGSSMLASSAYPRCAQLLTAPSAKPHIASTSRSLRDLQSLDGSAIAPR